MAHELRVEGDKVIESDAQGHPIATKDYNRVHAGYVATTHNPRVSDAAKHNAEEILHDLEAAHGDATAPAHQAQETGHNTRSHDHPHASTHTGAKTVTVEDQEAKTEHDQEVHRHRQIGAYKAVLHRDDRSEEAKQHAREELEKLGVDAKDL